MTAAHPRSSLRRWTRHLLAQVMAAARWTAGVRVDPVQALVAAVAFAAPVALALAAGHPAPGLAMAAGALTLSGLDRRRTLGDQAAVVADAAWPALAAIACAALCAAVGAAASGFVLAAACAIAALVGPFSRPLMVAAVRFILFLPILTAMMASTSHRGWLAALMGLGLAWTAALWLLAVALPGGADPAPSTASAPFGRRLVRWRGTLATRQGWQYPARLAVCLALGALLQALRPGHHLHWVLLTVAILCPRDPFEPSTRLVQRLIGALLGVVLGAGLILWPPPPWALVAGLAVIAGLRPVLRTGNYLAYTAVMTPLVLMIADLGHPAGVSLLGDRLLATLIGAALVYTADRLTRPLLEPPPCRPTP